MYNIYLFIFCVQISISSAGTRPYLRSDTPSSILSSDSDIRFTRKLGNQYRCSCYIASGFLVFLLLAGLTVYITYKYLPEENRQVRTFRGVFTVTKGDVFTMELADPVTDVYRIKARDYRESINLWLRRSELRPTFQYTDILAFDGEEGGHLVVHFNLYFNMRKIKISAKDVKQVLTRESNYLGNRTVDPLSIKLQEVKGDAHLGVSSTAKSAAELITSTPVSVPQRTCAPMELNYCNRYVANYTSYPNIVGHYNMEQVMDNVIIFRELVDSECYRLAQEFVCQLLQPPCSQNLILPCRSFCNEFWEGCGSRLPANLQDYFNCSQFPEYSAEGPPCLPKPGCGAEMETRGLSCDGVADCPDLSDETTCSHCSNGHLLCTASKACIHPSSVCDGVRDCPDGSDERLCLKLAPALTPADQIRGVQTKHYYTTGNVVYTEKGESGKLCVSNLNTSSISVGDNNSTLHSVALSLCRSLTFRKVLNIKVQTDTEMDARYVKVSNPNIPQISFVPSHCPTKEILNVECTQLECGFPVMRNKQGTEDLGKMASGGDWPWHVALFKDGVHICDATIATLSWLITTASCFQGQGKAEWIARAGSTRLISTSPWQQERHVMGMRKSPVEGSTIVMLKLDREFVPSDFVRPICLPSAGNALTDFSHCNTLGWARQRTMLQRVELRLAKMEQCANISITTVNSVCSDSFYSKEDCNVEELAGSPMSCLHMDGYRWVLAGVSNWRIACSKVGDQRPRLYDQIIPNIEWIKLTINS
uniref:Uncharacterized protein n=1 Tax=Rhodnius prolixus TaxID=13249 RepID=T1H9A8_RHOPR